MSILIKDMEMPESCNDCIFDTWGLCLINANLEGKDEHTHSCPLVPVPEHGRLIDADALMKILSKVIDINASIEQRNEATDQERRCLWWFEQQIGIAPTIIPADKEGEG